VSLSYQIFFGIAYCSIASALVPKKRAKLLKVLCLFTCLSFLLDLATVFPRYANIFSNAFRLIEFFLLLYIYYLAFKPEARKATFTIIAIVYLTFFLAELFTFQKGQLNSYSATLSSVVFIVFSVRYFYVLMRDLPTAQIQRLPMFWVNTAVLTYFAGSLFLFAMRSYLINVLKDDQTIYWSFHNFLNIGKNLLFAVALWQDLRKPKPI
jgi:hypothetical protein